MNLSEHGILVSVSVSLAGLLGERKDSQATEHVESSYGLKHRRAKATKYLIDRNHPKVKAVVAAGQQVRNVGYRYGFPWGGGMIFVPHKARQDFEAEISAKIKSFDGAGDEYQIFYPSLVTDSSRDLGGLFVASQYPFQSEVRKMLKASWTPWPMPDSGSFANLADDIVTDYQNRMRTETVNLTNSAINSLVGKVEKTVSTFVTKLAAFDNSGDKVMGTFRDSLISNVADIGQLIRKLNFTDDPSIDSLAVQVERLARHSAERLRETQVMRNAAVAEGEALLKRLDTFKKTESDVDALLSAVSDYA